MIHTLQFQVSLMRFFGRVKATFSNFVTIDHYLHSPFTLMCRNSEKPAFVCFSRASHVLKISESCHFSKIIKSVVLFVSVFMINMFRRKFTSHVKPRESMSKSFLIIDSDCPIASVSRTSRNLSNKIRSAGMSFPDKDSRDRIVIKNISDMVSCSYDYEFTIKAA